MSIKILEKRAIESYTSDILNSSFLRTGCSSTHSLLYAICLAFKYYRTKIESEEDMCQSLLDQIMSTLQRDQWFEKKSMNSVLWNHWNQYMQNVGDHLEKEKHFSEEEKESIEFITFFWKKEETLIPSASEFENISFSEFLSTWDEKMYFFLNQCIEHLENEIRQKGDIFSKMSKSHKKKVIFHLIRISKLVLDEIMEKVFQTSIHTQDNKLSLPLLCDFFKINILILNAETGKPSIDCMKYLDMPQCFENRYPFIVLLYFPSSDHFESLGKPIKRVQSPLVLSRFFTKKDPFVITYLAYLESQFPEAFRKD